MTAPQPSRKARVITFRFVPGGPDPITNGFGNFNPSTVVASVGIRTPFGKPRGLLISPPEFDTNLQVSDRWIGRSRRGILMPQSEQRCCRGSECFAEELR